MSKSLAALGWLLLSCFTAINLFTAAALYRASNASRRPKPAPREYSYVGCDYPPQLPLDISPAALVVNTTHRYGLTADDDWGTIFPNGNGWVRLGPDGRAFAVSMYHQLHCLDAIRVAMAEARAVNHGDPTRPANPNHSTGEDAYAHADHCFNYLRQGLLCAADLTLEASEVKRRPDGALDNGASGIGMVHQCKDWTQVRAFLEENHKRWEGIGEA